MAGFSFLVTVAFTLNYIIGSGFLTIPWAFTQTGCFLGFLILFILSLFSIVAAVNVVETIARANYLREKFFESEPAISARDNNSFKSYAYQAVAPASASTHGSIEDRPAVVSSDCPLLEVGEHKFEITELCEYFLGHNGKRLYTAFILLYFYGTLWAYATVFASAFDAIFGMAVFGTSVYWLFLALFACIVIPVSMLELTEQVSLQVALSIWRVVMLLLMVCTIFASELFDTQAFSNYIKASDTSFIFEFSPSKLHILLPIATYAYIFHHSIPSLAQPVVDKKQVANIFIAALVVCFVAYVAIGVVIGLYFGSSTLPSSNLNWSYYVGSLTGAKHSLVIRSSSAIISKFIVLFPACDVASAFPLNAVTLGNSLMTAVYDDTDAQPRYVRTLFRALATVPPLCGAFIIKDLGQITKYSGLCGFAIAFVFPPVLAIASELYMKKRGLPWKTFYGSPFNGQAIQYTTAAVGVFLIVFVLFNILLGHD